MFQEEQEIDEDIFSEPPSQVSHVMSYGAANNIQQRMRKQVETVELSSPKKDGMGGRSKSPDTMKVPKDWSTKEQKIEQVGSMKKKKNGVPQHGNSASKRSYNSKSVAKQVTPAPRANETKKSSNNKELPKKKSKLPKKIASAKSNDDEDLSVFDFY